MSRRGSRDAPDREATAWVSELADLARHGPIDALVADPRLLLLAMEPRALERHAALRAACAYVDHPHEAVRALALRFALHGDITLARRWVAWETIGERAARGGKGARMDLVSNPRAPRRFVEVLADDEKDAVRRELAERRGLSAEVRSRLARDRTESVRTALAACPDLQGDVARILMTDASEAVRVLVVRRRDVGSLDWVALATDPAEAVRCAVATQPSLPFDAWTILVSDASEKVRREVAAHVPAEPHARRLLRDPSNDVRRVLAQREDLPVAFFEVLAGDANEWVRSAVAQNPAAPEHVVEELASDPVASVATATAHHPLVSREVLGHLATGLRDRQAMKHKRCPPEAIVAVAEEAAADAAASYASERLLLAAAGAPRTPLRVVERLAADPRAEVRAKVAGRTHLSAKAVELLVRDPRKSVRAALAANPSAPDAVLAVLAKDTEYSVRRDAVDNQQRRRSAVVPR